MRERLFRTRTIGSGLAFSVSTITLLWSASKGAKALRYGLNSAYAMEDTRNGILVIVISVLAVIIMGVLVAAVLYIVFGGSVLHALAGLVPGLKEQDSLMTIANGCAILVLGILALAGCYTFLTAGSRRFAAQLPGAAIAASACGACSFGFRLYVDHFGNYTVVYGSIATVAMLLFWMYLTAYIILAGAFINRFFVGKKIFKKR